MNISDHEGIQALMESFGMALSPSEQPRYNVAPTQSVEVIRMEDTPTLDVMSWGVSIQSKGKKGQPITRKVSNSRSDKVWSSYLWRYLIPEQRVLVPVNGFYEWKRENKKIIQAYHITPKKSGAMFFAGIYKKPKDEEDGQTEVSIVTTDANKSMSEVHDRMPVILSSQNAGLAWIGESDRESLDELMVPSAENFLQFTPISSYVNKSSNEGPECITPEL